MKPTIILVEQTELTKVSNMDYFDMVKRTKLNYAIERNTQTAHNNKHIIQQLTMKQKNTWII